MWSQPFDVATVLQVFWINLLLSSDNVIVIGMVAHRLEPGQKRKAIFGGTLLAILTQTLLTFVIGSLITLPAVRLIAGLLLMAVAVKLLHDEEDEEHGKHHAAPHSLSRAMMMIMVANLIMCTDNILAVAAIAGGDLRLLTVGLAPSIAIIMTCGGFVAKLLDRWPWFEFVGAGFLGYIASRLLVEDHFLNELIPGIQNARWIVAAVSVILVLTFPSILRRIESRCENV